VGGSGLWAETVTVSRASKAATRNKTIKSRAFISPPFEVGLGITEALNDADATDSVTSVIPVFEIDLLYLARCERRTKREKTKHLLATRNRVERQVLSFRCTQQIILPASSPDPLILPSF
jgi:hypothetical protein